MYLIFSLILDQQGPVETPDAQRRGLERVAGYCMSEEMFCSSAPPAAAVLHSLSMH